MFDNTITFEFTRVRTCSRCDMEKYRKYRSASCQRYSAHCRLVRGYSELIGATMCAILYNSERLSEKEKILSEHRTEFYSNFDVSNRNQHKSSTYIHNHGIGMNVIHNI